MRTASRSQRLRLTVFCTALVVLMTTAESLLRRLDLPTFDACSATADFAMPDPVLGFAARPLSSIGEWQLNEMGLRGPLVEQPKPTGRTRILYLGDSTAWGLGLPLEVSFAARTTALLARDRPDMTFDFLVGAFPAYSSYHSRVLLERLLPLAPDLVVFYVGARNDATRHRYFRDAEIPARRARLDSAWHDVRLLRLAEAGWDRLYKSLLRKMLPGDSRARVPVDVFHDNMTNMAQQIRDAGVAGLIVVPPLSERLAEREPLAYLYRPALVQAAARLGLESISLQPAFERVPTDVAYFEDGYHFAAEGHAIAAREIHAAIEAHALLDRAADHDR